MDYSLLLAIEQNPYYQEHKSVARKIRSTVDGKGGNLSPGDATPKSQHAEERKYEDLVDPKDQFKGSRHMYLSADLRHIYHIAIIDYLQDYNFDKKLENALKTIWRGRHSEISAVPPVRYAKRFIEFMESEVFLVDKKSKIISPNEALDMIKDTLLDIEEDKTEDK